MGVHVPVAWPWHRAGFLQSPDRPMPTNSMDQEERSGLNMCLVFIISHVEEMFYVCKK
jgi:hypothetical protein